MRVLVLTSMFPHQRNHTRGWAVFQRSVALGALCEIKVVSPQHLAGVEVHDRVGGLEVWRPRWHHVPKFGAVVDGHLFAAAARRAIVQVRASFDFDLLDSHWLYPDGFAAVRLARRFGKPVVVAARGTDVNDFCFRWPVRTLARAALRQATRLVAVSAELKEKMVAAGAVAERISVVPNGVDTSLFRPGDRAATRRALGLPRGAVALLAVGTIVESKGIQDLLAGLADPEVPPGARLYIAGSGTYRGAVEDLARRLGLEARVVFLGKLSHRDLVRWYQAADLLVFGSWREGCPNVVLESLACGTPVVATHVGAVPDLVKEGRDGFLYEPRSPQAFRRALLKALGHPWDRAAIAEKGSRRTWQQVAHEYLEVFHQAIADFRSRTRRSP